VERWFKNTEDTEITENDGRKRLQIPRGTSVSSVLSVVENWEYGGG
jgi:hypothetical protein